MSFIPEAASIVLNRLNKNYEAFLVGGFVRDSLLERECFDIDITTSAFPDQVKSLFLDYPVLDTGIKHGTITIMINHSPVEVTTYRSEGPYLDGRHPSIISFCSALEEDLKRRDFTINALCLNQDNKIIDYHHGIDDLNNRLIRTIGNPVERFNEDALRILRAIRFSAQLDFSIDKHTMQAIHDCSHQLHRVSIERIMNEFEKILLSNRPAFYIEEYWDVFGIFLPELKELRTHPAYWQKALLRCSNCPNSLAMRLAALFAEIGILQSTEPSPMLSSSLFLQIAKRLKLSNALTSRCTMLIQNQMSQFEINRIEVKKRLRRWDESFFELLNWYEVLGKPKEEINQLKTITQQVISSGECFTLKQLKIDGNDIKELGYAGYQIRIKLEQCLDLVIEEKIPNQREDLIRYLQSF